jgi:2-amino-4-hydroxy-6-hydroxymethyldihydropteridine diphosphokinase
MREARERIAALPAVSFLTVSPLYESEPQDVPAGYESEYFLNAVLVVEYEGRLEELSVDVHAIESDMGRIRSGETNAPRPIDIDIIYAGSEVRADPSLTVPHPRCHLRRFVLQPLADLRPELSMPGQQETVSGLLLSLPNEPKVLLLCTEW